ncbi:MAG: geranylgeranylglyceryl/heptaprenylglyceryl phosphate synthase [Bacteroidota bacterium]
MIQKEILRKIVENRLIGKKSFAVLLDPDTVDATTCLPILNISTDHTKSTKASAAVDFFFVGGSLLTNYATNQLIQTIKDFCDIPIILFPGSNLHIDAAADAILLLSLISGRNPDLLIGQHVIAAPILKKSNLEIISTGYMLVESGRQTTVSYISNTMPIPHDKPSIAACTAMAGEMLGMKLIYLDAGSGAQQTVSPQMIEMVRRSVEVPLIVGGGINSVQKAVEVLEAGADIIVVGNGIEQNPHLLSDISEKVAAINRKVSLQ